MTDREVREACQMFLFLDAVPFVVAWLALSLVLKGTAHTVLDVAGVLLGAVLLLAIWRGLLHSVRVKSAAADREPQRHFLALPAPRVEPPAGFVVISGPVQPGFGDQQAIEAEQIVVKALFGDTSTVVPRRISGPE